MQSAAELRTVEEVEKSIGLFLLVANNVAGEPFIDIQRLLARYRMPPDKRVLKYSVSRTQASHSTSHL
jgi:hypothetical protein